jgi:hypothetical protein
MLTTISNTELDLSNKSKEELSQALVDAFIANGGKIQVIPYGTRSDPTVGGNRFGRKPKPAAVEQPAKKVNKKKK